MSGPAPEDAFLASFVGAAALRFALRAGLVDVLSRGAVDLHELAAAARQEVGGVDTLCGLLAAGGVVERRGESVGLSAAFRAVLPRRHALESKLAFLDLAARDVLDHLPAMLFDSAAYVASGRVFELFRYDLALEDTEANLAATRRWVDYTTALTEHEAPLLVPLLPIENVSRLLDVGGNSGAFALALCAAVPDLSATVLDLPVVVELGRRHVAGRVAAERVAFVAADMRSDPWPAGHDAVCFKSVLHDWPLDDARRLLTRARDSLPAGGRVVIVERGRFSPAAPLPFGTIANLVFSRFYRAPSVYAELLAELGFVDIETGGIEIDMPFHVVSGRRAGRR